MRVLVLTPWYPSRINPIEGIFVKRIAEAISQMHCVVVFAFLTAYARHHDLTLEGEHIGSGLYQSKENDLLIFRSIQKARGWAKLGGLHRLVNRIRALQNLLKLLPPFHLIHAHTYQAGLLGLWVKMQQNIPLIITEHWSGFLTGEVKKGQLGKVKLAYRYADAVCPVSEHLQHSILKWGVNTKRWEVIGNVVDINPQEQWGGPSYPNPTPVKLLFVSTLTPIKGLPTLIEALSLLEKRNFPVTLTIVGDGPIRKGIEELIEYYGLQERVTLTGYLSPGEVRKLFQDHHILVHPSEVETFSIIVAEAVAAGMPVVASDISPLRALVGEDAGILVPVGEPPALADAIEEMSHRLTTFSPGPSRSKIRDHFNPQAIAHQYDTLYRQLTH